MSKKILVSGFEAFGKHQVNPSEKIVESLRGAGTLQSSSNVSRGYLVLPVEFGKAYDLLAREFKAGGYDFLLMLGVDPNRNKICLERFALNWIGNSDAAVAAKRANSFIVHHAEKALQSPLPLESWCEQLGENVAVSNHAGVFVCNETYYRSLLEFSDRSLFVHVPTEEKLSVQSSNEVILTLLQIIENQA
jgi:pyroglutamyl-peptidase